MINTKSELVSLTITKNKRHKMFLGMARQELIWKHLSERYYFQLGHYG